MALCNGQGRSEKIFMDIRCPPITPGNFSKCFLYCETHSTQEHDKQGIEGAVVSLGGVGSAKASSIL